MTELEIIDGNKVLEIANSRFKGDRHFHHNFVEHFYRCCIEQSETLSFIDDDNMKLDLNYIHMAEDIYDAVINKIIKISKVPIKDAQEDKIVKENIGKFIMPIKDTSLPKGQIKLFIETITATKEP